MGCSRGIGCRGPSCCYNVFESDSHGPGLPRAVKKKYRFSEGQALPHNLKVSRNRAGGISHDQNPAISKPEAPSVPEQLLAKKKPEIIHRLLLPPGSPIRKKIAAQPLKIITVRNVETRTAAQELMLQACLPTLCSLLVELIQTPTKNNCAHAAPRRPLPSYHAHARSSYATLPARQ